jgi:hypothetical protein
MADLFLGQDNSAKQLGKTKQACNTARRTRLFVALGFTPL